MPPVDPDTQAELSEVNSISSQADTFKGNVQNNINSFSNGKHPHFITKANLIKTKLDEIKAEIETLRPGLEDAIASET